MSEVADITGCRKVETVKDAECGKIVTTEYFSEDGTLVRRDCNVQVSEEYMAKMLAGQTSL
jgi:hypothetical protein